MRLQKFSMILKPILALLLISNLVACTTVQERVVLRTKYLSKTIPVQPHPKPVNLHDVEFYAVTAENIDEFIERFEKENGDLVFFAISVPDYENISMNVAELRRYLNQQKAIIVYYENNIKELLNVPEETEEVVSDTSKNKIDIPFISGS